MSSLSYFWYGHTGSAIGTGLSNLLVSEAQPVGFSYCFGGGARLLLTTTNKDWVRSANLDDAARTFLRNMLRRLGHASWCG